MGTFLKARLLEYIGREEQRYLSWTKELHQPDITKQQTTRNY